MTMLGVHIFHYYSSKSITSNYIVFTGVKNFCLQSVAHARASVWSGRPQSADVCLVVQTCSFDTCVRCMRFLAYFLRFHCLNVTTLFNIDVKICFRAVATASCSAAILRRCCGHVVQHVFQVSQSTFSRVHCGISACKQSALCCYDGFCTNLCCANVDVLHCNSPAYK